MCRQLLLIALYTTIQLVVFAQPAKIINLKRGLSNNYAQCILQDKQGYMWIGTRDGLNRYDGYAVDVFRDQLPSSFIYSLIERNNGQIWIGTSQGGISIYDPEREVFETLSARNGFHMLANKDVYSMFEDADRNIWIGTLQGLGKIPSSKDTLLWHQPSTDQEPFAVTGICQDKNKTLWIGTNLGLFKTDPSSALSAITQVKEGSIQGAIRHILSDEQGDLWIATDEHGVFKYNTKTRAVVNYPIAVEGNKYAQVWNLYLDTKGTLWASVINGGLFYFDSHVNRFQNYNRFLSLEFKSRSITGAVEDYNGNLWITSHGDGVCYFNPSKYVFDKYLSGESLKSSVVVSSFLEDHAHTIWIGTDGGGVKKIDASGKIKDVFSSANGLSSNTVLDMVEDKQHGKWFATWQGGISHVNHRGIMKVLKVDSLTPFALKNPNIKSLALDTASNLSIVSHGGGISLYNLSQKKFIDPKTVIPGFQPGNAQWGSDILKATKGDTWIASHAGLFRYTRDYSQYYYAGNKSLSSSIVYCLFEDSSGTIWAGTNNGLERFDPEKNVFINYSARYGIPANVKCILEDNRHRLWISTIHEIVRFDPQSKKLRHFDEAYNVQEGQFHECACLKSSSGKMYFGGTEGFNAFDPDSIDDDITSSRLLITGLYLFNKKQTAGAPESILERAISFTKEIRLSYDQNVVSFEFLALNYSGSGRHTYSYTMEGFDKGWSPLSESRLATYTNLDPGHYTFRVKALTINGEIAGETSVDVNIIPPFWKTIWFRSVSVLALLMLTFGYLLLRLYSSRKTRLRLQNMVNERTKELQNLVATKNRLFSIIAHDLRNPFTSLLGFTKLLNAEYNRYSDEDRQRIIKSLHHSSSTIYSLLDNLLAWSKSQQQLLVFEPEVIYFQKLAADLYDLIRDEAEKKSIRLVLDAPDEVRFLADRNMLNIILRNLLSNALKYSPIGGTIEVSYRIDHGIFEIHVKDEGPGADETDNLFHPDESLHKHRDHNHGLGLILCKEFVEQHGGKISVRRNSVKGADFYFTLPSANPVVESVDPSVPTTEIPIISSAATGDDKTMVLIAEDDDEIRWYLKQILLHDYDVREATDGLAATSITLEHIPDLIISDMNMPGMDGLTLCKTMKSNVQTSHVPFIVLTAERDSQKKVQGYEQGADEYITKPFEPAVLRARIKNLLALRQQLKSIYQRDVTTDPENFTTNKLDQEFLSKLNSTIEARLSDADLNPDEIAREMNISRTGLYTKVKALTGDSVSIYVRNVRLKASLRLLRTKEKNVSEVAYAVGFNQLSYFTTCFKDTFGITPSEFIHTGKLPS